MNRTAMLAVAVLLLGATPVAAQDATKVDSKHYQVVEETDHVRIVKVKYGAGEKSVMHEHPDAVFVALTDNHIRMVLPDGETLELEIKKGAAVFTPAVVHQPENLTGEVMSGYLIELKHNHEMHESGEHEEH